MANDYLAKRQMFERELMATGIRMGRQQMCDMITLALRDPETMGKDVFGAKRILAVLRKTANLLDEFDTAFQKSDEADWYQDKLDARLREAYGDEIQFDDFYRRYDFLKRFDYKTKRWK